MNVADNGAASDSHGRRGADARAGGDENRPRGAVDGDGMKRSKRSFWTTPNGIAAMLLIAAAGYFLLAEHRAHAIAALPWLILLACPLMHVFMHRGHGGGHGHESSGDASRDTEHRR